MQYLGDQICIWTLFPILAFIEHISVNQSGFGRRTRHVSAHPQPEQWSCWIFQISGLVFFFCIPAFFGLPSYLAWYFVLKFNSESYIQIEVAKYGCTQSNVSLVFFLSTMCSIQPPGFLMSVSRCFCSQMLYSSPNFSYRQLSQSVI